VPGAQPSAATTARSVILGLVGCLSVGALFPARVTLPLAA
jgi:hypothetical protein